MFLSPRLTKPFPFAGRVTLTGAAVNTMPYAGTVTFTRRLAIATPLSLNQATPSCTTSNFKVYVPATTGSPIWAFTVAVWPAAIASGVRTPSHVTSFPVASYT